MEKIDYIFMQAISGAFEIKPVIVELGSRIINEQKNLSARSVFGQSSEKGEYIGVDFLKGEGVDKVCDVRDLPFSDSSINAVIAMNLFEHVEESWLAFDEIKRVISEDGVVIIGTPFCYEIHGCPDDFYRYTPDHYLNVFKDFKVKIIVTVGFSKRPKMVYFIGGNNKQLSDDFDNFRNLYAKKHESIISRSSKILSGIRSRLSPNHFRNDIKYQHTFDITLHT